MRKRLKEIERQTFFNDATQQIIKKKLVLDKVSSNQRVPSLGGLGNQGWARCYVGHQSPYMPRIAIQTRQLIFLQIYFYYDN